MRKTPGSEREAIRTIFLRKRIEYTTQEAAQLLRVNLGDVLRWIEEGTLHVEWKRKRRQLGGPRNAILPWSELATAAMRRWTVHRIAEALGRDVARVLPQLLRPAERTYSLPEYQVRLLEALALERGQSASEYLSAVLRTVEAMMPPERTERMVPGISDALAFQRA